MTVTSESQNDNCGISLVGPMRYRCVVLNRCYTQRSRIIVRGIQKNLISHRCTTHLHNVVLQPTATTDNPASRGDLLQSQNIADSLRSDDINGPRYVPKMTGKATLCAPKISV